MTNVSDNNWTFTMLDGNVEFVIEYDTDLVLWEENVNTTVLEDWDGYTGAYYRALGRCHE